MTKVKKGLIHPDVIEMLQAELNDVQDDLCTQCGATNVFDYAAMTPEQQQCVVYVLINSDDKKIAKLREREARMLEVLSTMGEKVKPLVRWLHEFTR